MAFDLCLVVTGCPHHTRTPLPPASPRRSNRPAGSPTAGFARATAPRAFVFPQDHGPHPEYATEWWYYTGNLDTADGRHFGFQLTFFRIGARAQPRRARIGLGHHEHLYGPLRADRRRRRAVLGLRALQPRRGRAGRRARASPFASGWRTGSATGSGRGWHADAAAGRAGRCGDRPGAGERQAAVCSRATTA